MVEAFFFFFLSIKRVFPRFRREPTTNTERGKKKKKKERKNEYDVVQVISTNRVDETIAYQRLHLVEWFCGRALVVFPGTGESTRSLASAGARARWRKYARMSIRVHRPTIRFDIPCLCNYAPPVSKRTLIELRRIMKIWFDTAMSRERISR